MTRAEKEISRLELRILKAGAVERKRLITDLLNFEQQAGQIEAQADPPRLRQQPQPIPITRLQKALAADEAILEYVLTDPASYCLVISRDNARVFKLASRAQIGKQVDQVSRPFEWIAPRESLEQRFIQLPWRRWKASCLRRPD